MMQNQTGSGMVKALLGIVILVAVLGALAVSGFVRGNTALDQAEAARIQAITNWETQMRQMELPYMQARLEEEAAITAAESEAAVARIEAERKAYADQMAEEQRMLTESNNLRLIIRERWQMAGMSLAFLLGAALILAAGIALAKILLRLVERVPAKQPLVQRVAFQPLRDDPEYRQWRIAKARKQEELARVEGWEAEVNGVHQHNGNGRTRINA